MPRPPNERYWRKNEQKLRYLCVNEGIYSEALRLSDNADMEMFPQKQIAEQQQLDRHQRADQKAQDIQLKPH